MAGTFSSGTNYIYLSNVRLRVTVEAVVEIAREIAATDEERNYVSQLEDWWAKNGWPGNGIDLDKQFHSTDEFKFWAQAFETLGWRVFYRKWGNHADETWQVGFIASCHVISRMLTEHVRKRDRSWWPEQGDKDGIRPDPMRIQQ